MIKINGLLRDRTPSKKKGNFSRTKGNNSRKHSAISPIIKLEEIMGLNNVTKFHKILIKTITEVTSFQSVNFHIFKGP